MWLSRMSVALGGAVLVLTATACAEDTVFSSSVSEETDPAAAGISVPPEASFYRTSAIGPDRVNYSAPEGSPMSFVDRKLLTDNGQLTDGMTATEAQSLQILAKLEDQLASRKLKLYEVGTVRAYLAPDGDRGTDFDGWQRAYRRYFANIDRDTGSSLLTSAAPTTTVTTTSTATNSDTDEPTSEAPYPGVDNRTRPTLVTVGVAEQPVKGWLVQIEIEAVHDED